MFLKDTIFQYAHIHINKYTHASLILLIQILFATCNRKNLASTGCLILFAYIVTYRTEVLKNSIKTRKLNSG